MPFEGYLSLPYVPRRTRRTKPTPHPYLHRIAYTETVRGLHDEIPTLLFHAPFALLKDACEYLYKMMADRMSNIRVIQEHSCRRKNGKCYWRVAVQIIGLDEQFMSLGEFTKMLVHRMTSICNCKVRHYRLETFLNL